MSGPSKAQRKARWPRQTWVSVALLVALLMLTNAVFESKAALELSPTTHGKAHNGFGVLYNLLGELGFGVERSRAAYEALDLTRTLWLIRPHFAASAEASAKEQPQGLAHLSSDGPSALLRLAYAGATVVVIEPELELLHQLGLARLDANASCKEACRASGPLADQGLELELEELALFEPRDGPEVLLSVQDAPFAVLEPVGSGHVVLIADAEPFTNEQIATADHAVLAAKLAQALGAPVFDERSHGLPAGASLLEALGVARTLLLAVTFAVFAACGLLFMRRIPARVLVPHELAEPSLARFVESLALLYGRSGPREPMAVYHAYLQGFRHRLRKTLYGRGRGSDALLSQRLGRELTAERALHACLEGRNPPSSMPELLQRVTQMERYLAETLWHSRGD